MLKQMDHWTDPAGLFKFFYDLEFWRELIGFSPTQNTFTQK